MTGKDGAPERKFQALGEAVSVQGDGRISGYASVFGQVDRGGDVVARGAYRRSLAALGPAGVKMLWQHDPAQPIGLWEEVREDHHGLWVSGRLLADVAKGREAMALVTAGAVDGLSIGYRTKRAGRDGQGHRLLEEVELWEVSLVTFPMQLEARLQAKSDGLWQRVGEVTQRLAEVRRGFAQGVMTGGERR